MYSVAGLPSLRARPSTKMRTTKRTYGNKRLAGREIKIIPDGLAINFFKKQREMKRFSHSIHVNEKKHWRATEDMLGFKYKQ
jgi:hypothetical protein